MTSSSLQKLLTSQKGNIPQGRSSTTGSSTSSSSLSSWLQGIFKNGFNTASNDQYGGSPTGGGNSALNTSRLGNSSDAGGGDSELKEINSLNSGPLPGPFPDEQSMVAAYQHLADLIRSHNEKVVAGRKSAAPPKPSQPPSQTKSTPPLTQTTTSLSKGNPLTTTGSKNSTSLPNTQTNPFASSSSTSQNNPFTSGNGGTGTPLANNTNAKSSAPPVAQRNTPAPAGSNDIIQIRTDTEHTPAMDAVAQASLQFAAQCEQQLTSNQ